MKTKETIEKEIQSMQDFMRTRTLTWVERNDYNIFIKALEWVLHDED